MNNLERLKKSIPPKGKLSLLYLNITSSCNLKCFYCYDEANKAKTKSDVALTLDEIIDIAEKSKNLDLGRVAITGGEPFVRNDWFEIGKAFADRGISVTYSTNGTLIDEEKIKKLAEINAGLQISLDGDDDIMNFVAKKTGIYSKVMEVAEIAKLYGVDILLNCVVGRHNLSEMNTFLDNIENKQIKCRLTPFDSSLNSKHEQYALDIVEKYNLIMLVDRHNETRKTQNITMSLPILMTPKHIPLGFASSCGWGYNVCGILSNGDVTVCAPAAGIEFFNAGNLRTTDFNEIWNDSEKFSELRNYETSDIKGICASCPVIDLCGGGCRVASYIKHHDPLAPGTLCQEYYDAVSNGLIKEDGFLIGGVSIERTGETV